MYGSSFVSSYGESPPKVWVQAIGSLTQDEVKSGLAKLGNSGAQFPPTLPQFIELCRPRSAGVRFLGNPVGAGYLLDVPKAPKEVARKHIENMRRKLAE